MVQIDDCEQDHDNKPDAENPAFHPCPVTGKQQKQCRVKKVLKMRFGFRGEPMTLEEIGKKVGLSRERVRQIEKRAKIKLLSKAKTRAVKDYLN